MFKPKNKDMPTGSYIPINCSFYDELEALATLRKVALIRYEEEGKTVEVSGKNKRFLYQG